MGATASKPRRHTSVDAATTRRPYDGDPETADPAFGAADSRAANLSDPDAVSRRAPGAAFAPGASGRAVSSVPVIPSAMAATATAIACTTTTAPHARSGPQNQRSLGDRRRLRRTRPVAARRKIPTWQARRPRPRTQVRARRPSWGCSRRPSFRAMPTMLVRRPVCSPLRGTEQRDYPLPVPLIVLPEPPHPLADRFLRQGIVG